MSFFLLFHIVVALSSIVSTSILYARPSPKMLRASYGSLLLTTVTGVVLILGMGGSVLGMCLFGLGFVGLVLSGILLGERKLARVFREQEG